MIREKENSWQVAATDIFWSKVAPGDHVVQLYENDDVFLETLTTFAIGGLDAGECVVIVATEAHLSALQQRLLAAGVNLAALVSEDLYIPLNARELLPQLITNGWPDDDLFERASTALMERAGKNGRRVRAFGEMVALLWADGFYGATIRLEHLWTEFAKKTSMCIFCAYPRTGFTEGTGHPVTHICNAHSHVINGSGAPAAHVEYRN